MEDKAGDAGGGGGGEQGVGKAGPAGLPGGDGQGEQQRPGQNQGQKAQNDDLRRGDAPNFWKGRAWAALCVVCL